MFLIGVGLAKAADVYHPVARIETKAGYNIIAVQRAHKDVKACQAANKRFIDALKAGCESCRVRANDCKTKLTSQEADAINRKPLKNYSVAAPGVRIILSGSKDAAKTACEQIAAQTSGKGSKTTAKCLNPGQAV